ncbi:hypothetical protein COV21_01025 [Candidatus Woesearchaeota archaeon CG10_big_fil_rev_8_21_14_0_10_45_5]|jgi:hypothetical protein|nr:MAG: hypothetical protein COV21_01025 [Candidatus Woesearchaeota archaeon CG10_big_fil_rev_8_21_14_0_10_45_5]PIU29635.1 MAG: hypothetical protein COT07_04860 [Candidatus Woesearchaeota archaeon CG07_land_8_20_14_0_80_44_23]
MAAGKKRNEKIAQVLELMKELENDSTVPRNVKAKIANAEKALSEDAELSLRVHKALNELDEISDDANMQPYTRTQVWNIVSVLESI